MQHAKPWEAGQAATSQEYQEACACKVGEPLVVNFTRRGVPATVPRLPCLAVPSLAVKGLASHVAVVSCFLPASLFRALRWYRVLLCDT